MQLIMVVESLDFIKLKSILRMSSQSWYDNCVQVKQLQKTHVYIQELSSNKVEEYPI